MGDFPASFLWRQIRLYPNLKECTHVGWGPQRPQIQLHPPVAKTLGPLCQLALLIVYVCTGREKHP